MGINKASCSEPAQPGAEGGKGEGVLASRSTPPVEFLPQRTAPSFIPSNIPVKMTLGVQIVYKSRRTAKFSGEWPRVNASVLLTEEKQMKKKHRRTCSGHTCVSQALSPAAPRFPPGMLTFQMEALRLREVW